MCLAASIRAGGASSDSSIDGDDVQRGSGGRGVG